MTDLTFAAEFVRRHFRRAFDEINGDLRPWGGIHDANIRFDDDEVTIYGRDESGENQSAISLQRGEVL